MKWRVLLELTKVDGNVKTRELMTGHRPTIAMSPAAIGLTLAEGKSVLAVMQTRLIQAQADRYSQHRRICSHCGSRRAVKDWRARQLTTLFGVVKVEARRMHRLCCHAACPQVPHQVIDKSSHQRRRQPIGWIHSVEPAFRRPIRLQRAHKLSCSQSIANKPIRHSHDSHPCEGRGA